MKRMSSVSTPRSRAPGGFSLDFSTLSVGIAGLDRIFRRAAIQTVNSALTARNWLIGCYIVEYEQSGADRAKYGERLVRSLVEELRLRDVRGMSFTNLNLFRQFYLSYPHLGHWVAEFLHRNSPHSGAISECTGFGATGGGAGVQIVQMASEQFATVSGSSPRAKRRAGTENAIVQTASEQFVMLLQRIENQQVEASPHSLDPSLLCRHLSFSHFIELLKVDNSLKRAFYEVESIKGNWSVAQLKRQIGSLLCERTGMSKDKHGLVDAVHAQKRVMTIDDAIRDPYILEFAGFPEDHRFSEHELETRLLDHIQSFLIELGNGFCFEARQKRITLDNEHDYVDLVFYHRILRCHVLIDLKVRKFQHGDAGQMNFYLNYYRDNEMAEGDNPPVGLILCASRDETRVKYATSGMDNRLFVSKYMTALPSEEKIRAFLADDRDRTELRVMEERAAYGEERAQQ